MLTLARTVVAHETVLSDEQAAEKVRDLSRSRGAQAVFDFVGALAAVEAEITLVGIGGGTFPTGFGHLPFDAAFRALYWETAGNFTTSSS